MNPITNMRNLNKMNDRELDMGLAGTNQSWHNEYKDSAWIFVGGLPYDLTEGDTICVFSQFGEVVHINLVRDHGTGKSRGFGFICYEDQRSTILAVDNLNGMELLKRKVRVDHVHTYKLPKDLEKMDADRRKLFLEGCAPQPIEHADTHKDSDGDQSPQIHKSRKKKKKGEKRKKSKKEKKSKSKRKSPSESSNSSDSSSDSEESSGNSRRRHEKGSDRQNDNYDKEQSRTSNSKTNYQSDNKINRRSRDRSNDKEPGRNREGNNHSFHKDRNDTNREFKNRRSRSRSMSPYQKNNERRYHRKDDRRQ